jgi:uncharacterized membrane protein YphA (DoxX/SURF4 family)
VTDARTKTALLVLRWALGLVVLVEAALFALAPSAHHEFAKTGMPDVLRLILGWGEILGAILLLIPRTVVPGAWVLIVLFLFAIVVHFLHGMPNVGALVVYTAAAWTVTRQ